MQLEQPEPRAGIAGTIKLMALVAVVVLALFGILVALDIVPLEEVRAWLPQVLVLLGILVAAAVAVVLLMRSGDRR